MTTTTATREQQDLVETLAKHRFLLLHTTRGLTDEQAAATPTASELCIGGIVKHLARTEHRWVSFATGDVAPMHEGSVEEHLASFRMLPGETLAGILEDYAEVGRRTEEILLGFEDLDTDYPLPEAPWFPPGARWSRRRVFLHLVAETAQHAGHADILRETIDGQKTMG